MEKDHYTQNQLENPWRKPWVGLLTIFWACPHPWVHPTVISSALKKKKILDAGAATTLVPATCATLVPETCGAMYNAWN